MIFFVTTGKKTDEWIEQYSDSWWYPENRRAKMYSMEEWKKILKKREKVRKKREKLREQWKKKVEYMAKLNEEIEKEEKENATIERMLKETEELEKGIVEEDIERDEYTVTEINEDTEIEKPKVNFLDDFELRSPDDDMRMKVKMNVEVTKDDKNKQKPTKSFAITYYFSPMEIKRSVYSEWAEKLKEVYMHAKMDVSWEVQTCIIKATNPDETKPRVTVNREEKSILFEFPNVDEEIEDCEKETGQKEQDDDDTNDEDNDSYYTEDIDHEEMIQRLEKLEEIM